MSPDAKKFVETRAWVVVMDVVDTHAQDGPQQATLQQLLDVSRYLSSQHVQEIALRAAQIILTKEYEHPEGAPR